MSERLKCDVCGGPLLRQRHDREVFGPASECVCDACLPEPSVPRDTLSRAALVEKIKEMQSRWGGGGEWEDGGYAAFEDVLSLLSQEPGKGEQS